MDEGNQKLGKSILMVRSQFKVDQKEGSVEEKDELLAIHKFLAAPAEVGVTMGQTVNMGNYESYRIDVQVTVPCYREEIEEAYVFARKFCNARLKEEVSEAVDKKNNPF